jgi:predicted negative regulator of RcsB-dependent stress response
MTSPIRSTEEFDLADFFAKNQRAITVGAVAIAAVGLGFWFWTASAARKAQRAEQAYVSAERAVYSGNPQLAESELRRLVDRYGNTAAGVRGAILLAKQQYQANKVAEGIAVLREAADAGASEPFRPAVHALIGAGYETQQKFDSAATAFRAAADAARAESEREVHRAAAARALTAAGKKTEAAEIWRDIASRESSPLLTEARLRLAELTVEPARQ